MNNTSPPAGYRESALGGTVLVVREEHHDALREALAKGSLHQWAAWQPGAQAMQGRVVAWATQLGNGTKIVVRHSHHGGMFAALTGDLFLKPPRAPHELEMAVALRAAGVPTPDVIGYAIYDAVGPFCRADVVTQLVDGADLPAAWAAAHSPAERDGIVDAMSGLLRTLQRAGARHPDLNLKNILISEADGAPAAWVLDVDRVAIDRDHSEHVGDANARRLSVSLAKWRRQHGLAFSDAHYIRMMDGAGIDWKDLGP